MNSVSHKPTQEEFAELSGIGYKFYQDREEGRKKQVWLDTGERLAVVYNVKTRHLLALLRARKHCPPVDFAEEQSAQ